MVRYDCIRRRRSIHHAERFADPAPPSGSESDELRRVVYPESAFSRTLQCAVSGRILQYHEPPLSKSGNRLQRDRQHAAVRENPDRNKPSGDPTWHPYYFLGDADGGIPARRGDCVSMKEMLLCGGPLIDRRIAETVLLPGWA